MSNINSLVYESLSNGLSTLAAGSGAGLLHTLGQMGGGALGAGLDFAVPGLGTITGAMLGGGLVNGGLNYLKNYTDPDLKNDHLGNALRALGSTASGSIPFLGKALAIYNGAKASHNVVAPMEAYNRHKQLQDQAAQLAMFQQARMGQVPQAPPPQPPQVGLQLPFMNNQQQ